MPMNATQYYRKVGSIIQRHGWMVQGVFATEQTPGFSYSIGMLDLFGFEFLVFALPPALAQRIINDLGQDLREYKELKVGEPLDTSRWLNGTFPFRPVQCNTANPVLYEEYVRQAAVWHEKKGFPVIQLLLPDANGVLPDEPGFDEAYMGIRQPRLDL